ncbi:sensor histidine kinase, partial [Microbacterium sp. CPCC 204701]|uniref:sensor histidine kinase n=1 Tax=Microbacterium sp. CPCC 204701 TaxID=2493084 RepID=UPI000FDC5985
MPAAPRVRSALSRSLHSALTLVALLATMLVGVEVALFPLAGPAGPLLLMLPLIFAVYVVAGLVAWKRRPSNGMGFLIVVAGFALYLGSLQNTGVPLLVGLGAVCATIVAAAMVHLLLAFPTGRLPDRVSRFLVAAMYVIALLLQAPRYLFDPDGPFPSFAVADLPGVVELLGLFQTIVASAFSVAVAVVLWGRLRRADAAHRRVLIPLFSYGIFAVLFMPLIAVVLDRVLLVHPFVRGYLQFAVLAGIPIAFALGTLRGGFARTGELEELGTWLGTASASKEPLAHALAHVLGDPSLRLYFWAGDRGEFLDADGRGAPARLADSRRGWETIVLDGRTIGAIDYDAALVADRELVRTAGRIVAIEVERARLTAELRASQRALMQSRERLVEAADRERRRIARDLHDGLQVRLVLLAL